MKPTKGIWILRHDGTAVDISWPEALKPHGKSTSKQDVSNAARYEVREQIQEYHSMGTCDECELCHKPMIRRKELHVDHIDRFEILLDNFLGIMNMSYEDVILEDMGLYSTFYDKSLSSTWIKFHREYATLRLVHHQCNLERAKK